MTFGIQPPLFANAQDRDDISRSKLLTLTLSALASLSTTVIVGLRAPSFKIADVGPMKGGLESKGFLRPAFLLPEAP